MDDPRDAHDEGALGSCFAWLEMPSRRPAGCDRDVPRLAEVAAAGSPCAARLAQVLFAAPRMLGDLIAELPASTACLDSVLNVLQPFAAARLLRLSPNVAGGPGAVFVPKSDAFAFVRKELTEQIYRFSRWVFVTFGESGETIIQTAAGTCDVRVFNADFADLAVRLGRGARIADALPEGSRSTDAARFVALLVAAGLLVPVNARQSAEWSDELLWEFHDLLFHTCSRLGRNPGDIGGTYPWVGKADPAPALKPPGGSIRTIPLPRPDLGWLSLNDITLTTAIEKRRSVRTHGAIPISLDELGHFLYRTARVRGFHNIPGAEFTSRPYANGGAGYELELYLCIDRCLELDRGFYYYEPEGHSLLLKRYANPDLERALDEAWLASAETCRPQVLIMIASRFKRVSWKYRGIAYATQLKNCGVLYANMYLVAESMNLAACALGLGNPTRFACLAGCDFYSEGTVGEFMLGTRAWGA